ncbi:double zinc ribbon domain-containing protein [Hankyongella ginsenosidimutans]|uniref:double zinc ribbon domain-containing protein n=1 Tax=Hankyongella ginsenosidimutans TaxID=1763828 RepID=UPI001CA363FB|nr:double zinc ribbon domain-containing protein [Hankyongella ginsenosidimutans]
MTLGRVLQSAARGALDLVLPPLCLACREQVRDPGTFCARCWGQLRFLGAPCCAQCGAPFPHEVAPGLRCAACLASPPPYAAARACWRYGDAAAAAIVAFKHADRTEHAQALARHMLRVGQNCSSRRTAFWRRSRCIGDGSGGAATIRRRCWPPRSPGCPGGLPCSMRLCANAQRRASRG